MGTSKNERLHYMDSLRAVAMFLGLVLHASVLYKVWVYDPLRIHEQPSSALHYLAETIHVFRMELFFLVAGFFSALVCVKRGAISYAKNRLQRILLPLLLCLIFLLPWAAAEAWLDIQDLNTSVFSKYIEFFLNPSYIFTTGSPAGGWLWHFWFLHVLCYFIGLYLLLNLLLKPVAALAQIRNWFLTHIQKRFGLFLLIVPTFFILIFSPPWADVPGVGTSLEVLAYYGLFFFSGVILHEDHRALDALASQFKLFGLPFIISLIFLIPMIDKVTLTSPPELLLQDWSLYQGEAGKADLIGNFPFLQNPFNFSTLNANSDWFLMCFLRAFCTWSAIAGFILLFKTYFNQKSELGRYAADSSYFIYLLHFPLQLAIGSYLRDHIDSAFACFLICLVVSVILCLLMYHFLCRNTWIGLLLSGRKYPLRIDQELNEIRNILRNKKCWQAFTCGCVFCGLIIYIEYQPKTRLLKLSHHAKAESVKNYLQENPDAELTDITRHDGRNALHMAAHGMPMPRPAEDVTATMEHLIKAGIPVDSLDNFGQTPLHYSIRTGNIAAMQTLLDFGANPNLPDKTRGNTALHLAATFGADKMLGPLIKAGGDTDQVRKDGSTPRELLTHFHQRDSLDSLDSLQE